MRRIIFFCALLLAIAAAPSYGADHRPTRILPYMSNHQAAQHVHRTHENRSVNDAANHRKPTRAQLKYFRSKSSMPYANRVDGQFTGTTDEILQWAAYKWGFHPDLLRAVAAYETWWHYDFVGDNGDSFGMFQMRRPYHCCLPIMRNDMAFNADYYGGILRSYYDGKQGWLNTVSGNGKRYRAGQLWNSVGAWASGRWADDRSKSYVAGVRGYLQRRVWREADFQNG